jgi:AcrR family transcriptional regulator
MENTLENSGLKPLKLQKSIDKKNALLEATLSLINSGGFQGASMSKVAKLAQVSPATIYLYFEHKQDLVNQLYLKIRSQFTKVAFEGFNETLPVKKSFQMVWNNIAAFQLNHADESAFLSQCDNTPIIDESCRKEGLKHLQPLLDLWERGQREEIVKDISPYLLYAYTIYPLAFLMNSNIKSHNPPNDQELQEAFQAAWDSIRV